MLTVNVFCVGILLGHNIWHNRAKIVAVLKSIIGGGGELAESALLKEMFTADCSDLATCNSEY